MKRLATLCALLLVLALVCPSVAAAKTGATEAPDHIALSWIGNPSTTMAITWRTDTSVTTGVVEYAKGTKLNAASKRGNATCSDFATDLGDSKIFRANLSDLSPNTTYCYRVGDDRHWSDVHSFTTADPKATRVKFLLFGDSQSNPPYSEWRKNVHNAYRANPDAKFFINTGDLVNVGQDGAQWNGWFDAVAGVIDEIPQMPVLGNHDTKIGKDHGEPAYWLAQFTVPQNGPNGLKSHAYSFDYGPAHLVILDSQGSEEKKQYGDIFAPQKSWLDTDLTASKAIWKLAFFHKAPYAITVGRRSEDVKKAFCPTLEEHHTDIVFNGHDHGVARTYPISDGHIKQKPSQGTVYCIDGRSGSTCHKDLEKKPYNAFFYNPLDQPNYQVVEINGSKLTVSAYKQDGTLISSFTLDKANDTDSDCSR